MDLRLNGVPIKIPNFLGSLLQLFIVFLFSNAFQISLSKGDYQVKMNLEVSCKLQGSLPSVSINVHPYRTIIEFVLSINLLSLGIFMEKQC